MSQLGGAPKGNQNARKAKVWTSAINKALEKRSKGEQMAALVELAEKLIDKCLEGDMTALKELGDRLEGKPAQELVHQGDEDQPVIHKIKREIVRTRN